MLLTFSSHLIDIWKANHRSYLSMLWEIGFNQALTKDILQNPDTDDGYLLRPSLKCSPPCFSPPHTEGPSPPHSVPLYHSHRRSVEYPMAFILCYHSTHLNWSTSCITSIISTLLKEISPNKQTLGDFPCGPVVKTPWFQCMGPRFIPWSGN